MKRKKVDVGRTYLGVVEDNQDPKKEGRVKVKVVDVFEDMKIEDIPWASPWKDLDGNHFAQCVISVRRFHSEPETTGS